MPAFDFIPPREDRPLVIEMLEILFLVLLPLQVLGLISLAWVWVLAPLWVLPAVSIATETVALWVSLVTKLVKKVRR